MGIKRGELGFIMGSNRFNIDKLDTFTGQKHTSEFGSAFIWVGEKCMVLSRHGKNSDIPPHMINHRANMLAFKSLGVRKIIGFTSVGSLKIDLEPTHMLMPDDYINMGKITTYYDNKIHHIVPSIDEGLRKEIFTKLQQLPINLKFDGIYVQTQGPRLETKAEIQMLKNFGDVVGMTMASEATLAKELEIPYANISMIDNYCNGLIDEPLTINAIQKNQVENSKNIEEIIQKLLEN